MSIVRDYYEVRVPTDLEDKADAMDRLADAAIDEARERAKLYCMPAEWTADFLREEWGPEYGATVAVFRVRRRRNNTQQGKLLNRSKS
jgi:hypothetical protein